MSRRMSVSMTLPAVRARTKTVTRRHADTWRTLTPGDHLTLIEKGMGLPKGAKQVVVAHVEIVDVRVEPIGKVLSEPDVLAREGIQQVDMGRVEFIEWWLRSHGHRRGAGMGTPCRRIEWRYLDGPA